MGYIVRTSQNIQRRVGEMVQQLQGLTLLLEDLGSEHAHNSSKLPVTLVSGDPMPSPTSMAAVMHVVDR